jgi:hypothetical protein
MFSSLPASSNVRRRFGKKDHPANAEDFQNTAPLITPNAFKEKAKQ